jgi:hypothetical protein
VQGVGVGVFVGVDVAVGVGRSVGVAVGTGVFVTVGTGVLVTTGVDVATAFSVGVGIVLTVFGFPAQPARVLSASAVRIRVMIVCLVRFIERLSFFFVFAYT